MIEAIVSDRQRQWVEIPGWLLLRTDVHRDHRGFFYEAWRADRSPAGLPPFLQDNISFSNGKVLRGLHLQHPNSQGKLVHVISGRIWDVSVDVRKGSPTFGKWHAVILQEADGQLVYIPPGVAHGFAVLSEHAVVAYKCTTYYEPTGDLTIRWNDPAIGIDWPLQEPVLSSKDSSAPLLSEIDPARLPVFGEE